MCHECSDSCLREANKFAENEFEKILSSANVVVLSKRRFKIFNQSMRERTEPGKEIAKTFRKKLQEKNSEAIKLFEDEAGCHYPDIPIVTTFTRKYNGLTLSTDKGHPIIVIDLAFMLGFYNTLNAFFNCFNAVSRYFHDNFVDIEGLLKNKKFQFFIKSIHHARLQLWDKNISESAVNYEVNFLYRFAAKELFENILFFIVSHEIAHIILGHNGLDAIDLTDTKTNDINILKKFQALEKHADTKAFEIYQLYLKTRQEFKFANELAPLILTLYLKVFESQKENFSIHPHPNERFIYLSQMMPKLDIKSEMFLNIFNELINIAMISIKT